MTRQVTISVENNFSRGLITEFSAINFPESAATEMWDCEITTDRKVRRRPGFIYEVNAEDKTIDRTNSVVNAFVWDNVTGSGDLSIVVVQVGSTLYFYENEDTLSAGALVDTVDLTDFQPTGNPSPALVNCTFSSGNGKLFVTHPHLNNFMVSYDSSTSTVDEEEIGCEIRDFAGVDDGLEVDERPTSNIAGLSAEHKYNLFNQGWHFNSNAALTSWDSARTDMPSNADAWWYYKSTTGDWDNAQIARFDPGNTPAAKGHYILDAFSEDRSTVSGVTGIDVVDTDGQRFSTSAFFAQRVFWAGIQHPGKSSTLYFSQIIEDENDVRYYKRCYQRNDPTNEDISDLLASDGGVIQIPDGGTIIKLFATRSSLLVFSSNGIWEVTGSDGLAFRANDYSVNKVSSINAISQNSFVDVDGIPMWWNLDGIFTLQPSGGLSFSVVDLTRGSIKAFFDSIPTNSKKLAKGAYNSDTRIVQWLYQSEIASTIEEAQEYDRILNFNAELNAFYPWTISSSDIKIHDLMVVDTVGGVSTLLNVVDDSGNNVVNDNGDNVVTFTISNPIALTVFKYLVSVPDGSGSYNFSFVESTNEDWLDWVTDDDTDGVDYTSYLVTGYKIRGDTIRNQQSTYIFPFFEKEENSSCLVQGLWDWASSSDSGKFSTAQQGYSTRRGDFSVVFKKLKIRGKGRALQVKFSSESGKPFTLLGWSTLDTVAEAP